MEILVLVMLLPILLLDASDTDDEDCDGDTLKAADCIIVGA